MTYAADGQRRRGRPPRISRDHIVDAAYELGIQNLTMAGVAERLGVTHQSLYGWVQDRHELIDLVSDRLIRQIEILPPADPADWRDSLRSYANGLRLLSEEMPGFASAGLGRFRATDGFIKLNRDVVLMLADSGFEPALAQRIYETLYTVLLGWMSHNERLAAALGAFERSVDPPLSISSVESEACRRMATEQSAPSDERFEFLVHTLLAGLPDPPREAVVQTADLDLCDSLEVVRR